MANPFGELVDDDKLDQMLRYVDKPKTQEDRAREAMNLINDNRKNVDAANYVQSLKDEYGNGVSVLCLIYNATGDTVQYVADHDWYGYVGRTPYPVEIGNGQWGAFLHVHRTSQPSGSQAAVVYRGKNMDGDDRDYLIAWDDPWAPWFSNKVYCKVKTINSHQSCWDVVYSKLAKGNNRDETNSDGCHIQVSIGGGTSPTLRAILITPFDT